MSASAVAANRFYGEFDFATFGDRPQRGPDTRRPFQVDRDRIVFSTPFRQLQSKTQVFQSGKYDFYRTRLTHSIEVSRIARSIAEHLNVQSPELGADFFIDPDLVEAVGLAHDLGHPPFGHIGERTLNDLMRSHGGFEGNAQSLRILTDTFYTSGKERKGMAPTRALLDGVLKYQPLHAEACMHDGHTPDNHFLYDEQAETRAFIWGRTLGEKEPRPGKSIECQIMDWADDAAYSLHDIVDGIRARFITLENLHRWGEANAATLGDREKELLERLQELIQKERYEPYFESRLGRFIHACQLVEAPDSFLKAETARHQFALEVDEKYTRESKLYKRLAFELIFQSAPIQQIEFKGGRVLTQLFQAVERHYLEDAGQRTLKILPEPMHSWVLQPKAPKARRRLICDYLSGLTDASAVRLYKRLYDADFGSLADLV
ncbi:MAG: dNTP triphosphohydrolase [Verrucomicrobiota bacterium JB022]|nr:dNTP triphosphohydrolase [Verrucomicrobiota bacterium JB022]